MLNRLACFDHPYLFDPALVALLARIVPDKARREKCGPHQAPALRAKSREQERAEEIHRERSAARQARPIADAEARAAQAVIESLDAAEPAIEAAVAEAAAGDDHGEDQEDELGGDASIEDRGRAGAAGAGPPATA